MATSDFRHLASRRSTQERSREEKREETREGCIRIGAFVEFLIMQPSRTVQYAEVLAYAAAAARGDVLPVCMRLTWARADADWSGRSHLVRKVGAVCETVALDRAVSFMPDAPEPRLLRAARAMAAAEATPCATTRRAWLACAHGDLLVAARLDPMDLTARSLLAELFSAHACTAHPSHHTCAA